MSLLGEEKRSESIPKSKTYDSAGTGLLRPRNHDVCPDSHRLMQMPWSLQIFHRQGLWNDF